MKKLNVYNVKDLNKHLESVYRGEYKDDLIVVIDGFTQIKIKRKNKNLRMWFLLPKAFLEKPIALDMENNLGIKLSDIYNSIDKQGIESVSATYFRRPDYYEFISLPDNLDLNLKYIPNYGFVWNHYKRKIIGGLIEDYMYILKDQFYLPSEEAAKEYIQLRNFIFDESDQSSN